MKSVTAELWTYLDEQGDKGVVLEIHIHLIIKGVARGGRKHVGSQHLLRDVKRTHDRIFFIGLSTKFHRAITP
jgi:hypothetical protein